VDFPERSAAEIQSSNHHQSAGKIEPLLVDGAITRHSIRGLWYEREVAFDAAPRKPSANTLTLTVPAGPVNDGVIDDCVRLELDESAPGGVTNAR
jgi:rhamnogalacturonan endolyase